MHDAAIAVDFYKAFDIESDVTAKITFHNVGTFYLVTELSDIVFSQIFRAGIRIDSCLSKDVLRAFVTDPVNIRKSCFNSLIVGKVNTGNTSHT
jgi:hypothetical protein